MQTFELLTMTAFLIMYLGSALHAVITPEAYRDAEIAFYKSGKPGAFELLSFSFTTLAFMLLILHFVMETASVGQIVLYAMAFASLILPQRKGWSRLLGIPSAFLLLNAAAVAGFFRFLRGFDTGAWQPTASEIDQRL